jgi:hypothetical protein
LGGFGFWATATDLRRKLFGEDDEAVDEAELDKAKAEGENGRSNFYNPALTYQPKRLTTSRRRLPRSAKFGACSARRTGHSAYSAR